MKKIKLLFIITKLELGGAQLSTLDIIRGLDRNIYEIYFLTSNRGILISDVLAMADIMVCLLSSLNRQLNILYDLKSLFYIYRFIRKHKIDIVHTHSSKAGIIGRWAAKFAKVKVIIHTVHGWEFHEYQSKIKKWIFVLLEKITASITDIIIAVTNYDINKGRKFGIGKDEQYRLIRYGIDRERFNLKYNGIFRKENGIPDSCFVVGMVACFKPQKSPLDFVYCAAKATEQISNIIFVMVGDGVLHGKITKLIGRLNLKEKFILTGWQSNIPYILSSFDILVLSSLWEGLPIVFLEAMASGKPIVATNVDGNSEIVKDGLSGFLVKPKNPDALAERIVYLYNNRDLVKHMGESGKKILDENFDIKHKVKRMDFIYQSCLNEKSIN